MLNLGSPSGSQGKKKPFYMRGKTQSKTSQHSNIQSNAIQSVCVLVSCYLCVCPAEGMYYIGTVNSCACA